MPHPDEVRESFLLVKNASSIDETILLTLLEETGATVETVRSVTAAVKKLRSDSFACTVISAADPATLTRVRTVNGDRPVIVLRDGSSVERAVRDDHVYFVDIDTNDPRQTVDRIETIVVDSEVTGHLGRHARLQNTIRRVLSAFQTAESREELATVACKRLVSSNLYTAAWSSVPDGTTLTPQTAAGIDVSYLSPFSLEESRSDGVAIEDDGTGSTVTIPLRCETEFLGTLSLVASREIDDAERDLLRELGDDVARAILTVRDRSDSAGDERILDIYVRSFSHELRNHLQTARTELQEARIDEERYGRVRAVLDRIERLDREALLLTHRSVGGDQLSTHSLSAIIGDVRARMPRIEDTLTVLDSSPIVSHRPLVELLLENLFRNALDHAGPAAQVRVGMVDDGFFVEDTGDGLPNVPVQSLFEWDGSVNGNSGVGLPIVKRIVDLHGWDVSVTESAEGGVRFEITDVTVAPRTGTSAHRSGGNTADE